MSDMEPFENLIIKRRTNISNYISKFFPNVIAKLISEYDYYLKGKANIITNQSELNEHLYRARWCFELPDKRIVSVLGDKRIKIWNMQTQKCDITFESDDHYIFCANILSDGRIISFMTNNEFKIWNAQTGLCEGKISTTLIPHNDYIIRITTLPDGRIVTGSRYGILKIWNLFGQTEKCEFSTFMGHSEAITCMTAFPDPIEHEILLISGSYDSTLKIWNAQSEGKCKKTLEGHSSAVSCMAKLHDEIGPRLVSGSCDYTLKIWNLQTGLCDLTLKGHTNYVTCVAVLPDGQIISGSEDRTLKIWNAHSGICEKTIQNSDAVSCIVCTSDGRIITNYKNTLKLWN
jgi:WD40 repeat protein